MSKKPTKLQEAMRKLGSLGGKANVRKYGKGHMSKIQQNYWKSPAGLARRNKSKK